MLHQASHGSPADLLKLCHMHWLGMGSSSQRCSESQAKFADAHLDLGAGPDYCRWMCLRYMSMRAPPVMEHTFEVSM